MNRGKAFAVLSFLVFSLVSSLLQAQEMRIAIVTVYEDINDTASIQSQIDSIAAMNYNAVAIHARYRGDATYFPNKYDSTYPNNEPRTTAAGNIDVLEEFTTRGHAAGLKVFAYVNLFCITDGKNTDSRSNHLLNVHPEWVTYANANGNVHVQTTSDDPDGKWIDPGIPAARAYMADICGDIVQNYQCDGIMIDRIRYPWARWPRSSMDFGYHPTAIANFHAQYGGTGTPYHSDANWIQFRRDQVKEAVREVYSRITAIDPHHLLLAYPIGTKTEAFDYCYQQWTSWLEAGYIDVCFPQIYDTSNSSFTTRLEEDLAAYSGTRSVGVAIATYKTGIDVAGQINIVRNHGLNAVSLYRHSTIPTYGYTSAVQSAFASKSVWPTLSWKPADDEYIIDNNDSSFTKTGSWGVSTGSGYYGTNSLYAYVGGAAATARWTPNLATAGTYNVYTRWVAGTNRSSTAPFRVYHNGVSTNVIMNETANGSTWNRLGTWEFAAGSAGYVELSDQASTGSVVSADAVMFELVSSSPTPTPTPTPTPSPTPALADIIVDNTNSGFSASSNWFYSTSVSGYYGTNYSARAAASASDSAAWTATLPTSGTYDVYARWTTGSNRVTSAPFIVYYNGGSQTVYKNQQQNNGEWVLLGTYSMSAGTAVRVRLSCWTSSGSYVIADAVRLVQK